MFTIGKQFSFASAHQLSGLPDGHKCGRLHGHNYTVDVIIQSQALDETGFVIDYGELSFVKDFIDKEIDHKNLNDIFDFQTTAENLAQYFYFHFKTLLKAKRENIILSEVIVTETPKTFASYKP
jgi:6-pyruvoyltetrahydropterin/6-carboxytetrahydropterin synthase